MIFGVLNVSNNQNTLKWFNNFSVNAGAPRRLFTFPFAGGNSMNYRQWPLKLNDIEVIALRLPGRETRMKERPYKSISELIEALLPQISPLLDRPFSFFGHSMGALIAFELACQLEKIGLSSPKTLFLSASCPLENRVKKELHTLSDRDLLKHLIYCGGIPAAVLADRELLRFMLPMIRADFFMLESFDEHHCQITKSDIVGICGSTDPIAPFRGMQNWSAHTTGSFKLFELQGGHFFIKPAERKLLELIGAFMESSTIHSNEMKEFTSLEGA